MKERMHIARGLLCEIGFSGALLLVGYAVSALLG
jgi:hypothetical protein